MTLRPLEDSVMLRSSKRLNSSSRNWEARMTDNLAMTNIRTVDRLEVLVLVDNVTDSLSSNPNSVQTEWAGLLQSGRMQVLSGKATCCAHHGLSLLITAYTGGDKRTLLFDAGPHGETAVSYT